MKHEESNLRTKESLAASLKKHMQKKPFSKITVSELIKDCNINRNTFYYHFENIYDLLKWTLSKEIREVSHTFDMLTDYESEIRFTLQYIRNNSHILSCAYDSIGRDELKRLFYQDFTEPTRKLIEDCEKQNGLSLTDSFRDFICDFMAESTAGIVINAFKDRKLPDDDELVTNISVLMAALPNMLKKAPQK